jgi:glycosyltransferase involved in cell wall biosynthesis
LYNDFRKYLKILYVTAKGGIHDYRFLQKLVDDFEVLLLHYEADELIDEIKSLKGLKIVSRKPWPKKTFPYLTEKRHFKKVYTDFKPDIVHTGYVWQVGILASHYDIHPHLSMVWGSDILFEPDHNMYIKRLVRKVMKQCDHIQCDAEFVKKKIISDYSINPEKITVFPWGIDLSMFKKMDKSECRKKVNIPESKFVVLFDRNLESVYGIEYMLEGFKKFSENKNDVLFLLIAAGSLESEIKKFISDNLLEDKIKLIGRVPNKELPVFLNAADVYISTSNSDGTSLALLEAMACGLALIVSDVPAIQEWVNNENGFVVPKRNSQETANALEKYYASRSTVSNHGEKNMLIASERANWDKNYLELKKIYNKILS